jgi:hypothetical protein
MRGTGISDKASSYVVSPYFILRLNKVSGSRKYDQLLEYLGDYQLYTKDSSPWHCYGGEINNTVFGLDI